MRLNLRDAYWPRADDEDRLRVAAARALSAFCVLAALSGGAVTALNLRFLTTYPGPVLVGAMTSVVCLVAPALINGAPSFFGRSRALGYLVLAALAGLAVWDGSLYNPANFLLVPTVMTFTLVLGFRDGLASMLIAAGTVLVTGAMGWNAPEGGTEIAEYGALASACVFAFAGAVVFRGEMLSALQALAAQKAAAERANAAKSQFLANMSHELRTPLNGVLGMAEMLEHAGLQPDDARAAQIIRESGEHLNLLIGRILDYSNLDAGVIAMDPQPFDAAVLADHLRSDHAPRAKEAGLSLTVTVGEGGSGGWCGDLGRIREIADNLVTNALRFTVTGGVEVVVDGAASGEGFSISVADTGPGVPEALREAIFQPFTQADESLTREHGGVGLGLTIARRLAEAMGGTLSLTSPSGGGSVFRLDLPLRRAEPAQS